MSRLPISALIAALVVVAAGSVIVTTTFKQSSYVVNATALSAGQGVWIYLDFIPQQITLLGAVNATYSICVYANATMSAVYTVHGTAYSMMPGANWLCFGGLVNNDWISINVLQMFTDKTNSTIYVFRTS
jgi:predicted acyltransferase (DUF342 family)